MDGSATAGSSTRSSRGEYPADVLERFERDPPAGSTTATCATIAAPLDFLGVNYYTPAACVPGRIRRAARRRSSSREGSEHTDMGWEVYPDGLYELLVRLHDDYEPPPLYVTENGAAFADAAQQRQRRRPAADLLPRAPPRRARAARSTDGVPVRGLLRLVAARQLRVGARVTRSASASSTSTSRRSSACRRRATPGTATSSRPSAPGSHRPRATRGRAGDGRRRRDAWATGGSRYAPKQSSKVENAEGGNVAGKRNVQAKRAPVAQWTERRTSNPRVAGSNPAGRMEVPANRPLLLLSRRIRCARRIPERISYLRLRV